MKEIFLRDDKQILSWNYTNPNVYLTLTFNNKKQSIGRLVFDGDIPVFISKKKPYKIKKFTGFTFNFSILSYVERLEFLYENIMYRISRINALKKGNLIYTTHTKFETQMFIDIKFFIQYKKEGNSWIPQP